MVAGLQHADFSATCSGSRVILSGTADAQVSVELERWLLAVVAERGGAADSELVIDLLDLEFMTGGCVKAFVALLDAIGSTAGGIRLRFVSNAAYGWQKRSLAALSCMAANLITVDVRDHHSDSGIA